MYYSEPEAEEAYHCRGQYCLGNDLIVAPFTSPTDPDTRLSSQAVWLPPGDWINFFTGEHYSGDGWRHVYGGLADTPVFARAGAIVPLGPKTGWGGVSNPAALSLHVFPGADNRFELYEDDGESVDYLRGGYALTAIEQKWEGNALRLTIAPAAGEAALLPVEREWQLVIRGVNRPDQIELLVDATAQAVPATYDEATETLTVGAYKLKADEGCALTLAMRAGNLLSQRDRTIETVRRLLKAFRLESQVKGQLDRDLPGFVGGRIDLSRYGQALADSHVLALTRACRR
jgi:hypothetical protein